MRLLVSSDDGGGSGCIMFLYDCSGGRVTLVVHFL